MDKNTIIGLSLIGVILAAFSFLNQPSKEEVAAQRKIEKVKIEEKKKATVAAQLKKAEKTAKVEEFKNSYEPKMENGKQLVDKNGGLLFTNAKTKKDTVIGQQGLVSNSPEQIITLENAKLKVDLTNKGGMVSQVILKNYKSFEEFSKKDSKPGMVMFEKGDAVNQLKFTFGGKEYKTGDHNFVLSNQTKSSATYTLEVAKDKEIQFIYKLSADKYELEYEVKMDGLGEVTPQNVQLNWKTNMKQMERLLSEERRVATVFWLPVDGSYDYLSEMGSDEEKIETDVKWVAFKNAYFSSILTPETPFKKDGSVMNVMQYNESNPRYKTHVKYYSTSLNLGLKNTENVSKSFSWYFGPNTYEGLKASGQNHEDIINYGWGLFRWINLYAIQPIFNLLGNTGMNLGIAILLLTIILKLVLMPIQWKMFVSSAKMRLLKPDIDAINAKYPKKEEAMKKQSEMMSLYRESGASPLAGCLPMLIQMPILLAVFRFFPASFDLRQKDFLWATDLSSYDTIYNFGFTIPLYGDHISLFTLLMSATTLAYTAMNNQNMAQPQQPGMPNMKVIMYIFPFMMIFFFNNYSAGLSYYYFISTLISILLTLAIKYFFVDEAKLREKMQAKKADAIAKGPRKSKMQQRLEDMQKAQADRMKQIKKK